MDWGTANAVGAGLSTLGDLWLRKLANDEEQRRWEQQQKRLEKKDQEDEKARADTLAQRKRERDQVDRQAAEARTEKAMADLLDDYQKRGVVVSRRKARQYATAEGMPTLPAETGMPGIASSVYNAAGAAGRSIGDEITARAMRALVESGKNEGSITDLGDGYGFAQDEAARKAAEARALAKQKAVDDAEIRKAIAEIAADSRRDAANIAASGRAGDREDKRADKYAGAEAWFNDVVQNGAPMRASSPANASRVQVVGAFDRMRAAHPTWTPQQIMLAVQDAVSTGGKIEGTKASTAASTARADAAREQARATANAIGQLQGETAPPAGAAPVPGAGTPALPPSVDQQKYASDPKYRAWVNSKLGLR